MFPREVFWSRVATSATPEAYAGEFPPILPMPCDSVSRSPAPFVGRSSESIVPWLTVSRCPEQVPGEVRFSTARSRPSFSNAPARQEGMPIRWFRLEPKQAPKPLLRLNRQLEWRSAE